MVAPRVNFGGPTNGRLGHLTDAGFSSLGDAANKYGSQPGHSFVVSPGQFHVALDVLEGLVSQPPLQHRNGNAFQYAVTSVGMPEGVRVGPGRADSHLEGRLFHNLAQVPPGDVQHRPLPLLVVE